MAWPGRKIGGDWRWALALGRRLRVCCCGLALALALPIALALVPAPLSALFAGSIALARLPTSPALCLLATGFTAIARLRTTRPEQPFAAFEQTTPGPLPTVPWTFTDVPDKMTMVHGRVAYSRCSSLGAKRLTSLRGVSSRSLPLLSLVRIRNGPIPRSAYGAVARDRARFWPSFSAPLTPSIEKPKSGGKGANKK